VNIIDNEIHQVHIQSDFVADGVGIWIALNTSMGRRLLRIREGNWVWEDVVPASAVPASITLSDGHARALMSALLDHYHGTPDSHTQRADLMHERQRRDILEDTLIRLVQPRQPQVVGFAGGGYGGQGGSVSATSNAPHTAR
jgi:hypothetical protein